MDYKFDLEKLETAFSEDFSSSLYSILADEYLKQNDIGRATTVATIGQENNPDDIIGKYVLAKIYLFKNELQKAKSLLEEILNRFPLHLNARRLIIEIIKKEGKNSEQLNLHIEKLQEYFVDEGAPPKSIEKAPETVKDNEELEQGPSKEETKSSEEKFKINASMATFTVVDILISQKHFNQALEVLKILEKKGQDLEKIKIKRDQINKKIGK